MAKIYGELEKAQLENVAANPSVGVTGRVAFNTTDGVAILDDGVSIKKIPTYTGSQLLHGTQVDSPSTAHGTSSAIVGISDTQVLTNKDIDGGTMTNTNRLVLPKGTTAELDALTDKEALVAYDTTKKLVQVNDGAGWTDVGAGGSGGINVISQNTFSFNIDGVSSSNGDLTFSHDTTNPLSGSGSLLLTKAAGFPPPVVEGEYWTIDAFSRTVDAPIAMMKTSCEIATGTNVVDNAYELRIYDVTHSAYVAVLPEGILAGKGFYNGSWQTPAGGTSFEVRIVVVSDAGTLDTLTIDNLQTEKYATPVGTVVTEWKAYTPGWVSTSTAPSIGNGDIDAFYRRVGDQVEVTIDITMGSTTTYGTGTWKFGLPAGLNIDVSKQPQGLSGTTFYNSAGTIYCRDSSTVGNSVTASVQVNQSETAYVRGLLDGSVAISGTAPFTWADGDNIAINFSVPIVGWGAQAILGEDAGQRAVASRLTTPVGGTAATGATTYIGFDVVSYDKTGSIVNLGSANNTTQTSTTYIEVAETGLYSLTAQLLLADVDLDADERISVRAVLNGTPLISTDWEFGGTLTTPRRTFPIADTVELTKGDIISLAIFHEAGADVTIDITANSFFTLAKLSSPQQVAAGEKVYAEAKDASGQSVANGANITFDTIVQNSHNAIATTGIFTAPRSGVVKCGVCFRTVSVAATVGQSLGVGLELNGTPVKYFTEDVAYSTTARVYLVAADTMLTVSKGDTLNWVFNENLPAVAMSSNGTLNHTYFYMD